MVVLPLAVIGSLVHRARTVSRYEFTREGIRLRSSREFTLHWNEVVRYDIDRHALPLHLRDGRRHEIDLYVVIDPSLVRQSVLSLVPESTHRGEPA